MFIRFGEIPTEGRSINFRKLSFRQQSDIAYFLRCGDDIETAAWRLFEANGEEEPEGLWGAGISCFKADENGLPIIENAGQAASLKARIGDVIYMIDGDVIGIGQDDEPLLANVKKIAKVEIEREKLESLTGTASGSFEFYKEKEERA